MVNRAWAFLLETELVEVDVSPEITLSMAEALALAKCFFGLCLQRPWSIFRSNLNEKSGQGVVADAIKDDTSWEISERVWTDRSLHWELDIFRFVLWSNTQRDLNPRWQRCSASSLAATKAGWKSMWKSPWKARLWFDPASPVFIGNGCLWMLPSHKERWCCAGSLHTVNPDTWCGRAVLGSLAMPLPRAPCLYSSGEGAPEQREGLNFSLAGQFAIFI